jgi:hypothetical protein
MISQYMWEKGNSITLGQINKICGKQWTFHYLGKNIIKLILRHNPVSRG